MEDPTEKIIHRLAIQWALLRPNPTLITRDSLTYSDYLVTIRYMAFMIEDRDRIIYLFSAVLKQAKELNKSAEWIKTELNFEASVEVPGSEDKLSYRKRMMAIDVKYGGEGDDTSLDLYNHRLNRFNDNGKEKDPISS